MIQAYTIKIIVMDPNKITPVTKDELEVLLRDVLSKRYLKVVELDIEHY